MKLYFYHKLGVIFCIKEKYRFIFIYIIIMYYLIKSTLSHMGRFGIRKREERVTVVTPGNCMCVNGEGLILDMYPCISFTYLF